VVHSILTSRWMCNLPLDFPCAPDQSPRRNCGEPYQRKLRNQNFQPYVPLTDSAQNLPPRRGARGFFRAAVARDGFTWACGRTDSAASIPISVLLSIKHLVRAVQGHHFWKNNIVADDGSAVCPVAGGCHLYAPGFDLSGIWTGLIGALPIGAHCGCLGVCYS